MLAGVVLQVLRCLIISLDLTLKIITQTWECCTVLSSRCFRALLFFLPPLSSYYYWFMSSAALCSGGLWERRSWQRLSNTQVGARGLICCTGSQQGHNCDISLPPTSQIICSLVFKIPNIAFWHPASFDLKDCWLTDCSLHLPKSPPSLSLSLLFAIPSSFSQFICIL